jgi:hypothetical protein
MQAGGRTAALECSPVRESAAASRRTSSRYARRTRTRLSS